MKVDGTQLHKSHLKKIQTTVIFIVKQKQSFVYFVQITSKLKFLFLLNSDKIFKLQTNKYNYINIKMILIEEIHDGTEKLLTKTDSVVIL